MHGKSRSPVERDIHECSSYVETRWRPSSLQAGSARMLTEPKMHKPESAQRQGFGTAHPDEPDNRVTHEDVDIRFVFLKYRERQFARLGSVEITTIQVWEYFQDIVFGTSRVGINFCYHWVYVGGS